MKRLLSPSFDLMYPKVFLIFLMLTAAACGSSARDSEQQQSPPSETPTPDQGDSSDELGAKIVAVGAEDRSAFDYPVNATIRLPMMVMDEQVAEDSRYNFALGEHPIGMQLLNRNGTHPELLWNAAAIGTYSVVVIARNMTLCEQILADQAQNCAIAVEDFGSLAPDPRFDLSQRFELVIRSGSEPGFSPPGFDFAPLPGDGSQGSIGGGKNKCQRRSCGC